MIYGRISSTFQDSRGFSIQQQISSCKKWATVRGMTIVKTIREVASGANNQPLLCEFVEQCRDASLEDDTEINTTLLVFSPCRFSRSYEKSVGLLYSLREYGVTVMSTLTETAEEFLVGIEQAETEHSVMKMRLRQSVQFRKENGGYVGTVPFGYKLTARLSDKIKTLQFDKDEQMIVQFIADCRTRKTTEKHLSTILGKIQSKSSKSKSRRPPRDCCVKFSNGSILVEKLSFRNIAQLLNDFDVKRRGHRWTTHATREAFRRHENEQLQVIDSPTQSTSDAKSKKATSDAKSKKATSDAKSKKASSTQQSSTFGHIKRAMCTIS